ncbi:putative signal transducing protein [Sphingobacterium psychroaquaticum]|uniref:Putative signal transducing protein n=1 Tax=Sphingobacterium psychroaquaticum TaxID=561061 RepID=A0A1X7KDP8_9SPHI|nr:DUF2007 domain-containing protein [Sphingobacterium psychroaquaticum]QBQ42924.1 hypothetical protein E2P86_17980 [Sphingobacterium psychroaquaticum]SMG38655.1 Putative signal transducing protein [Sphingobacterium psychroaquaticum]
MEKNWVKVESYIDVFASEFAKQLLEQNGIDAVLLNKQDSSLKFGKIELLVQEENVALAKQLIAENQEKGTDEN